MALRFFSSSDRKMRKWAKSLAACSSDPASDSKPALAPNLTWAPSTVWAPSTAWAPSVGRLEPRLVLNASAELNPLGELLLVGTGLDDSLRIEFDQNAAIQIYDDSDPAAPGQIVPVTGHPNGIGNEFAPLLASDISSGQVRVDLGPGNDSISLPLLGSLDVVVLGQGGNDTASLQLDDPVVPATGSLYVQAEQITLSSASNDLSLGQADVQLVGAVRFDPALTAPNLQINNQLSIIGSTTLSADTTLSGTGLADLVDSTLSANASQVDLRVAMPDGDIRFGEINSSAGQLLSTLTIDSGSEVRFDGNEVLIENGIVVDESVSNLRIDSAVVTSYVELSAANISILDSITSSAGDMQIESTESSIIDRQAELFAGDGRILLSGNGSDLEAGSGVLRSNFDGDAIILTDFDQVQLGNIFAANGQLSLGTTGGELGDVMQEASSGIVTDRLAGVVTGDVNLANAGNQIRVVTDLVSGGNIVIADSTGDLLLDSLVSNSGSVNVVAAGGLAIGQIKAIGQTISLEAERINDDFVDNDDDSTAKTADLFAQRVTLTATNGVGAERELELDGTAELIANSNSGDITLTVLGEQSIVVTEATTSDANISLTSTGTASDLIVDQVVVIDDGLVTLISSDDIVNLDDDVSLVSAQQMRLISVNSTNDVDSDDAIKIRTEVNDLAATVTGSNRGDVEVINIGVSKPLRIGVLASGVDGSEPSVQTANGQIVLQSAAEIEVVDTTPGDAGPDWKSDPEIVAHGEVGRVDLEAPIIDLQDDVQIHGEKLFQDPAEAAVPRPLGDLTDPGGNRDERTIFLAGDEFYIGAGVELFTGNEQGTARQFLSRPLSSESVAGIEDAFFDPNSVETNVLTQALQNDATGILTFNVGTEGERGLTVTIDWGDSDARRFQQIDNLHANENATIGVNPANGGQPTATNYTPGNGTAEFTHLYLEQDTLDSRSNGRSAATDPYTVRFAVRHHVSIVVQSLIEGESATVFQSGISANPISVSGGLISSTDNPTTNLESDAGPLLETGTASFIIPNVTIPVAFFPVRDVIPEFESVTTVISVEQPTEVLATTLEVAEAPATSIVSREEHFQLRVLSPDPNGEDLAPPEKLPREIFDGDRLRKLFSRLPDGAYEIERVVGDGNERSILRVEVRDGEATIPEDELDEGVLQLKPLKSLDESPMELPIEYGDDPKENVHEESDYDDRIEKQERKDARLKAEPDFSFAPGVGVIAVTGTALTARKRRLQRPRMSDAANDRPTRSRLSRGSRFGKRRYG